MARDIRVSTLMRRVRSTSGSRFRLAVSMGFVIATVGALSLSVGERPSVAQAWGTMPDFFGGLFGQPQQQAVQPSTGATPQSSPYRQARHHARTRHHDSEAPRAVRFDGHGGHSGGYEGPTQLGRVSMCVRLCDGFAFPVGAYHGSEDNTSHEATCRSECPGAQTALYILPSGTSSINESSDARTGEAYSELPVAFHYTTVLSDACSCHAKSGGRIASLLRDFTLRRGDAVMTRNGFQVFHGGTSFPYKRKDFVALAKSPDIRREHRSTYRAIERASLVLPRTVADAERTRKVSEMDTVVGKQASR